jgi:hypothetical protein
MRKILVVISEGHRIIQGTHRSWCKGILVHWLLVVEELVDWFNGCWLLVVGYKGITI